MVLRPTAVAQSAPISPAQQNTSISRPCKACKAFMQRKLALGTAPFAKASLVILSLPFKATLPPKPATGLTIKPNLKLIRSPEIQNPVTIGAAQHHSPQPLPEWKTLGAQGNAYANNQMYYLEWNDRP